MKATMECGELLERPELRAHTKPIRFETRVRDGIERQFVLSHRTVGYVPAGSCARYQDHEVWIVDYMSRPDCIHHCQSFASLAEAEANLASRGELIATAE